MLKYRSSHDCSDAYGYHDIIIENKNDDIQVIVTRNTESGDIYGNAYHLESLKSKQISDKLSRVLYLNHFKK